MTNLGSLQECKGDLVFWGGQGREPDVNSPP